ncbi:MAG: beta-lactamase family protein [Acidobacteria bacterium]|nr:beta-lactamase family protein [Acidobacteriota bacterium]
MFPLLLAFLDPGSALVVLRDGKPIQLKVEGAADIQTGRPITPKTNFRLASVTKQFTATAILLLAKDGKLAIDDPAAKHIPNWPAYANAVTVRHLLTHTSGLPDYDNDVPDSTPQLKDAGVLAYVRKQSALLFAPGSKYQYSNTGYAILALIVEHTSGKSFPAFLKASIFKPLGMKHTVAHVEGQDTVTHRAYGHSRTATGWKSDDQSATSAVLGDGGIYSSVHDLAKWVRALDSCKLLDCRTLDTSWTSAKLNDGTPTNYGFGWRLETRDGQRVISHTRETRGFRNALLRYPDKGIAIILLTNRNEGTPADIAAEIVRNLLIP